MKSFISALILVVLLCFMSAPGSAQPQVPHFRIVDSLKLGGEGGWDYLTVDTSAERLYVSRGTRVQVVDLTSLSIVGEIPETPGVHGVALVPGLDRGYTSNGHDSSVTVFNTKNLQTITKIKIDGRNPDAILFDPFSQRIFTFNGGSDNATAIDVKTNRPVGNIPLGGKPEFAVTDGQGHVFVNIEDKSWIVAIDPEALKVMKSWSLAPGEEPSGLALDKENGLLFSACANRLMVISSVNQGKSTGTVPIGGGVDGAGYDPVHQLAFSSNGEGTMTVVREEPSEKFTVVENTVTRRGARTMAVDVKTGRIYTVAAKFGPPPAPTADRPRPRPTMEQGSQTLFVISH